MEAKTWKYVENSFESATRNSRATMAKIVVDHDAKLNAASTEAGADAGLATLLAAWAPKKDA